MASAPDPALEAWDNGDRNGLDEILARAFGVAAGYLELNGIVEQANYTGTLQQKKFSLFQDLGLYDYPMKVVIPRLRAEITAVAEQRATLEAIFRTLRGNYQLRDWARSRVSDLLELVPEPDFEAARAEYETDRLDRRVRGIRDDLTRLAPMVTLDDSGKELARDVIVRLEDLNGYKSIHDALHTLQMEVMSELARLSGEQITPLERRQSIVVQLQEMKLAVDRIRRQFGDVATPAAVQSRDSVVQEISRIAGLTGALDTTLRDTAETAAGLLRAMLRQQMSLFDSRLVETSEQIPFDRFARKIAALPQPDLARARDKDNPTLLDNVSSSFGDVAHRLANRQKTHRLWQQAEATILNIEELLRGAGREIEIRFHWENLEELIKRIAEMSAEPDLTGFLLSPDLRLAFSDKVEEVRSEPFRQAFGSFVRFARVLFQRADSALLEDCGRLKSLNNPLEKLL
jgi:hypothetical protein